MKNEQGDRAELVKIESKKIKVEEEKKGPAPESPPIKRRTPKQDELNEKIAQYTSEIEALKTLTSGPTPRLADRETLKSLVKKRAGLVKELNRCKVSVRASQKRRVKLAQILKSSGFPLRPVVGRPPVEESEEFKELPDLIVRVAQQQAAADPRRRAELLTLSRSLDDLKKELEKEGLKIKRSTLYMRLIPRRKNSIYGKRHVRVVPVQLRKPQFDGRKKHVAARFCFATGRMIRELAS